MSDAQGGRAGTGRRARPIAEEALGGRTGGRAGSDGGEAASLGSAGSGETDASRRGGAESRSLAGSWRNAAATATLR